MLLLNMIKNIKWSDTEVIQTKTGLKQVQKAPIPPWFWEMWKTYKEKIKEYNISPSRFKGEWELCLWSDYEIKDNHKQLKIDFDSSFQLYPFQEKGVEFIESREGKVLIADQMGLGKTIQVISWLKIHSELRPALIVCPNSLKINWRKEINKWTDKKENPFILYGKKEQSVNKNNRIFIINYDIFNNRREGLKNLDIKVLVIDESHLLKNPNAKRTQAIKKFAKKIDNVICLTGTPIVNRPIEIFTTLNILRPDIFKSRWQFAQRFCGLKHNGFGWDMSGASNIEELHDILIKTIMIRRLKKDVLKDLPEKQCSVVPIEIDNKQEYDFAENDLIEWIRQNEGKKKAEKASYAEHIVRFEKLKQLATRGKFKFAIEWIKNYIEDEKLVIFCTHHKTIDAIMTLFSDISVKIDGRNSTEDRQKAVEKFQSDKNIRIFIGNIKAAGVGITLTASSTIVFLEFPWTPGELEQAEDRCHRIGQENSVNIYYLIAENTIEEEIIDILDKKKKILSEVLDGKEVEKNSLIGELLKNIVKKSNKNEEILDMDKK